MSPMLAVFFKQSTDKDGVTVSMEGPQCAAPIISEKGQSFVRSLFPSETETVIRLVIADKVSVHRGLSTPIGAKLKKAVKNHSEGAATLLREAIDGSVSSDNGKKLFDDAYTNDFDVINDIVTIRKLIRTYVSGPKPAKKSVLVYLPDPPR